MTADHFSVVFQTLHGDASREDRAQFNALVHPINEAMRLRLPLYSSLYNYSTHHGLASTIALIERVRQRYGSAPLVLGMVKQTLLTDRGPLALSDLASTLHGAQRGD